MTVIVSDRTGAELLRCSTIQAARNFVASLVAIGRSDARDLILWVLP